MQVPGKPNQRRGGSTRNQKQSDVPSNGNQSAEVAEGSYHNWLDEMLQTHSVAKDSGGVDFPPLDGNNTYFTEDYRPREETRILGI